MKKYILLFPGSFSPYTDGHYDILKKYEDKIDSDGNKFKAVIIKSKKEREGLSPKTCLSLIEQIYSNDKRVKVIKSVDSPIKDCYNIVDRDDYNARKDNAKYVFVASTKDDDKRVSDFYNYFSKKKNDLVEKIDGVDTSPLFIFIDTGKEVPISASNVRDDIRKGHFKDFMGNYVGIMKDEITLDKKQLKIFFNDFAKQINPVQDKDSEKKIDSLNKK